VTPAAETVTYLFADPEDSTRRWQQHANLPAHATALIGRESQIEAARGRLSRPDVRLLTLTGPGGIGKTRLGLQVAADLSPGFADGVFFVQLAPLADPELVGPTIARALGLREAGDRPLTDLLEEYLRDRQALLVLDNFEHLIAGTPVVADLLAACPRLKVLVTSREPLRVYGEHELAVPPLTLPPHPTGPADAESSAPAQYEAVQLFVERAQAVRADLAFVGDNAAAAVQICRRLDGLPLAIELAAAHVRLLPPPALLARLDQGPSQAAGSGALTLLTDGPRDRPARQRTLRDTIAWSYDVLTEDERALFRRLGVFRGGWTLEAAEAIAPGVDVWTVSEALVAKSLVQPAEPARFVMLETIREYAREQLVASGDLPATERAHAEHYVALVEQAALLDGPDQTARLAELERELDNRRAALAWSLRPDGDPELGLRLMPDFRFWILHGHLSEAREWLARLLADPRAPTGLAHGRALLTAAFVAFFRGDYTAAGSTYEECRAVAQKVGDLRTLAVALNMLGLMLALRGDARAAEELIGQAFAMAVAAGWPGGRYYVLQNVGVAARLRGDLEAAKLALQECLVLCRRDGDTWMIGQALANMGLIYFQQGDYSAARADFAESLSARRALGDKWGVAWSLADLADGARELGQSVEADALYRESLAHMRDLGEHDGIARVLEGLAGLAVLRGQADAAARLAGAAEAQRAAVGAELPSAWAAEVRRWLAPARRALGESGFAAAARAGRSMPLGDALALAIAPPAPAVARTDGPLSPREREVAALVARGLTNRHIADELVISERTADRHVSNILAKLDLGSRAQIAVWHTRGS
jgi:predicted ATPase/DNA-binding CsgD family transcriptional regulator